MSSNHAKTCKESILVDVKELLKLYDRVTIHLPKIRREHSAVKRFEDAAYNIIHNFTIAFEMRNDKKKCLAYKEEFSVKARLNRKYKLNLKVFKNEQNGIRRAA